MSLACRGKMAQVAGYPALKGRCDPAPGHAPSGAPNEAEMQQLEKESNWEKENPPPGRPASEVEPETLGSSSIVYVCDYRGI